MDKGSPLGGVGVAGSNPAAPTIFLLLPPPWAWDFHKKKAGKDPAFEFVLLREGRIRFHEIHPTNPLCTNGSVSDVTAVTESIF